MRSKSRLRKIQKIQLSYFLFSLVFNAFAVSQVRGEAPPPLQSPSILTVASNKSLTFTGSEEKRVFFKKAYTIELYLEADTFSDEILSNVAKRIDVTSHTKITREKFLKMIHEWLIQNADHCDSADFEKQLNEIDDALVDLKPGDQFSVTYVPDDGTYFVKNDQMLGHVAGEPFGRTFFSIWVGDKPLDPSLKSNLLAYAK